MICFLEREKNLKLEMFVDVYVTYDILLYYIVSTYMNNNKYITIKIPVFFSTIVVTIYIYLLGWYTTWTTRRYLYQLFSAAICLE